MSIVQSLGNRGIGEVLLKASAALIPPYTTSTMKAKLLNVSLNGIINLVG